MAKRIGPKSKPTGFVPSGAKRGPSKAASKQAYFSPEELAVRDAYCVQRSRWESIRERAVIVYKPPESYDGRPPITVDGELVLDKAKPSIWRKLADWFAERQINPDVYMRVQFASLPQDARRVPEPAQIISDRYLQVWSVGKDDIANRVRLALRNEKGIADDKITSFQSKYGFKAEDAYAGTLTLATLGLSPLFRYCLARSIRGERFKKIARRWRRMAVLQYMAERHFYLELWASILPKGFDELAVKRHRKYMAEESPEVTA